MPNPRPQLITNSVAFIDRDGTMMVDEIAASEADHAWPWPAEDVEAVRARARTLFRPPSGTWGTVDWLIREWLCDLASLGRTTPRVRNLAGHVKGLTDRELTADILLAWLSAVSLVAGRQPVWLRRAGSQTTSPAPMPTPVDLGEVSRVRQLGITGRAREIRQSAQISATEAASAIGVSPATLSRWERGVSAPRPAEAVRWAQLLASLAVNDGNTVDDAAA